ncbi:signal peptidase I [Leuconostocaceae bacterium ESL0723]|nr:signal peptidase I [Leuconostocaceae bacterium ESL0723]
MSRFSELKIKDSFWLGRVLPTVLVALILGLLVHFFLFSGGVVRGSAMQPNLKAGQYVWINRVSKVERGDVIAFKGSVVDPRHAHAGQYVQRVIAVGGDTVKFQDGQLYVNGHRVRQEAIADDQKGPGTALGFGDSWDLQSLSASKLWKKGDRNQKRVPKGAYFVLGDDRSQANDSRYFGFVSQKAVLGRVTLPAWAGTGQQRQAVNDGRQQYWA